MPLKLSLKPGEKFVLNGAVLQNGDRRGVLVLQNKANVLREKDIMQEDEVNSPARRIYFPVMMMYLDPDRATEFFGEFGARLAEFVGAAASPEAMTHCLDASRQVASGEYYKALMACRRLIEFEDERIGPHVAESLPERRAAG
ncbi:MAG: flagellar biosynthesis repressor FlbT [Caulobacteraceae bacterium]|nr:flagellar biosynthesis repressor FlbT [Caulobacter sp.]